MGTYSFKGIKNIYVIGDCHGEFKTYFHGIKCGLNIKSEDEETPHPKELERQARKAAREQAMRDNQRLQEGHGRRIAQAFAEPQEGSGWATLSPSDVFKKIKKGKNCAFSDSLFIIAGDCGLGFNKPKYYEDLFEKFNKILSYNNTYVVMVRGNHDDPAYFDGERVNLSNIKAVPDYSVINANDKNILCVGGAISLDRTWRIKQEERINRFSTSKKKSIYWKDEAPIFNKEALDKVTNSIKIDYVVSHSAPSFVNPENHIGIDEWSVDDKTLVSDIKEERRVLDKVFETLRDCDMRPKYWAYGHFDYCFIEKRSDTLFRGLGDGWNPIQIDSDIERFFIEEEMRKKKGKKEKKSIGIKSLNVNEVAGNAIDFRVEPMMINADGNANDIAPAPDAFNELLDGGEEERVEDNDFGFIDGVAAEQANEEEIGAELPNIEATTRNIGEYRALNFNEIQRREQFVERLRQINETARIINAANNGYFTNADVLYGANAATITATATNVITNH